MKAILKFLVFLLLFGSNNFVALAQGPDDLKQIETISKYIGGNSQRLDQLLTRFGYQPPGYLSNEFSKYPALRKIRMAYQAAENGTKNGGKILIEKFYENLSNKYQGIRSEKELQNVGSPPKSQIEFKHPKPKAYNKSSLPKSIRGQLLSISKYVEGSGLGGARGVLKHRFQLTNDQVFDILNKSLSNNEALEKGISMAKEPPPKQERIKRIASEIDRKFQSARSDPGIQKIVGKNESIDFKKKASTYNNIVNTSHSNAAERISIKKNRKAYKSLIKRDFSKKASKAFSKMKVSRRGFGGIIFGNDLVDNTELGEIDYLRYLPTEGVSSNEETMIDLELVFKNGEVIFITSLYAEDVYAAHSILYNNEFPFIEGEGLGILSIEPLCHPGISNTKLFPIFLYCDKNPTLSYEEFESELINDKLSAFRYEMPSNYSLGWYKITDIPLRVEYNSGELFLKRNDTVPEQPYAFITLASPETEGEITAFYKNVPLLTEVSYEFNRLNEFARVFALLRWAKRKNGKLIAVPEVDTSEQYSANYAAIASSITSAQVSLESYAEKVNDILNMLKTSSQFDPYYITDSSKSQFIEALDRSREMLVNSLDELVNDATQSSDFALCDSTYSFPKLEDYFNSSLMEFYNLSMHKSKLEEVLIEVKSDIAEYGFESDKEIKMSIIQELAEINDSLLSYSGFGQGQKFEHEFSVLKKVENPSYRYWYYYPDEGAGLNKFFEHIKNKLMEMECD